MISSIGSGYLLNRLAFPLGYQIVFCIGFFGAAMSSLHLYLIKLAKASDVELLPSKPEPVKGPEETN